jgi:hypothetical protein
LVEGGGGHGASLPLSLPPLRQQLTHVRFCFTDFPLLVPLCACAWCLVGTSDGSEPFKSGPNPWVPLVIDMKGHRLSELRGLLPRHVCPCLLWPLLDGFFPMRRSLHSVTQCVLLAPCLRTHAGLCVTGARVVSQRTLWSACVGPQQPAWRCSVTASMS